MVRRVPRWILKFEKEVSKLRKISKNKWYLHPQPSLVALKRTGRGNCVAWSKLMTEIAIKHNLLVIQLVIGEQREKKNSKFRHQITVVIERDRTVWLQSNIWQRKFCRARSWPTMNSLTKLLKRIARINGKNACGYKNGTSIYITRILGEL